MRRLLVMADAAGLLAAFALTYVIVGAPGGSTDGVEWYFEPVVFTLTLPVWLVAAKLQGLYDQDEVHPAHSTVQEFAGVVYVVTLGSWVVFVGAWLTSIVNPTAGRLALYWALAIVFLVAFRSLARGEVRRRAGCFQNAVIVGAGNIGQLVARKLLVHKEYGINVVGFVDARPRELRGDLRHLTVLGGPDLLPEVIQSFDVERVIVAFSNEPEQETLDLIRSLRERDVHVDLVPRLFELVGPNVSIHDVEGLPLVGLASPRPARSSRLIKRTVDVVLAAASLGLMAPLFAYIAIRVKLDSPGPIFFRQTRLGLGMHEFTALKFRTMRVDVDDVAHRDYVRSTMSASATAGGNGLYKLDRSDAVTQFGHRLRRTSLDELPQLINVLRGDMSLVGPRPCIPYEVEHFRPHHFERFLVPSGVTGLWQVKARAQSTFGEALDLDVAYVRGWSLGLDLELLFRTPCALLRQRRWTA